MNLATNDFANRELSIEELEAIAAGNWLGDAVRWVGKEADKGLHWLEGPGLKIAADIAKWIGQHPPVYNGRRVP